MTRIMNPSLRARRAAGRSRTIQSVDRAAALLKAIADSSRPPTVVELAEACMLNRSTAWRLLATLDAHGLIERDPVSQRYSLGYAFLRIAAGADVDPLVRRARPVLEQLARDTSEATNLAVAKRFNLVYVDQVDPPQIMAPNWFGRPVPLHATSTGKAYLAFLTPEERRAALPERLERYTETTITDRRRLAAELEDVRRDGWAICVGELEESLFGASAPVLSEQGRPVAVVSVWGTEHRLPRERLPEIGRRALAGREGDQGPPAVSEPLVEDALDGDVCVLRLCRPEKLNALSTALERALGDALESARGAPTAPAVVLAGSGRAFSAGADISEFADRDPEAIARYYRESGGVYERVAALPQPTISAIHGYCLGGGLELALATDFRVADETAVFGFPEVAIGILPSSGGTVRATRLLGPAGARS